MADDFKNGNNGHRDQRPQGQDQQRKGPDGRPDQQRPPHGQQPGQGGQKPQGGHHPGGNHPGNPQRDDQKKHNR